jgi:hypothetical protein
MEVITPPNLTFTCNNCVSVCKGDKHKFRAIQGAIPMLYQARCAWCKGLTTCAPSALIVEQAVADFNFWFQRVIKG